MYRRGPAQRRDASHQGHRLLREGLPDQVHGHFTNTTRNDDDQDGLEDADPSARTMGRSYGAWLGEGVMIINDYYNNRYALFVD